MNSLLRHSKNRLKALETRQKSNESKSLILKIIARDGSLFWEIKTHQI